MIWVSIAMWVVSFIVTALLTPKPRLEDARPGGLDDLTVPQADEGTPIAVLLGKRRLRAPNTLWYSDFEAVPITQKVKTGFFSSKRVIIGYKYYLGFDLGLCLGEAVHLTKIWIENDEVWSGDISGEATIAIQEPSLFGGSTGSGGFVCDSIDFYGGSFTQSVNSYVDALDTVPAYNGLSHVVFQKAYIGNSPTLHTCSFELYRYPNSLGLTSLVNRVGDDLNPAEALYQVLISEWGGLDVDPSDIGTASFVSAASTLADEGNGISLLITKANSGKDIAEEILRQIDGILYQDPSTGTIELKLIRADYAVEDLDVFDESNIASLRDFTSNSWDDTINQFRVTYTNASNKYENGSAMVQDMANINSQQRLRSSNVSFPGCSTGDLAVALATRELAQYSVPLFKATLELKRNAASLRPGDPFLMTWSEYNLEQIVMRVQRFNLGDLLDGRVVIECVQDKFATDLTVFAAPEPSGHTPIDVTAVDITAAKVMEAPYWLVQQAQIDLAFSTSTGETAIMSMAKQPNAYQQGYKGWLSQPSTALQADITDTAYTNTAQLAEDILITDGMPTGSITDLDVAGLLPSTFTLEAATSTEAHAGKNLFVIDGELFTFLTFTDNGGGSYTLHTVKRALLDSVVAAHVSGATIYFLTADALCEGSFSYIGQVTAYLQSYTYNDEILAADAAEFSVNPAWRYDAPLPPDYITVDGSASPATVTTAGAHAIAWLPRSRLVTTIAWENDSAHTEEAGVLYNMRFYLDGVLQGSYTQLNLSSPSATLTLPSGMSGTGKVEIESVRGSFTSFTKAFREFAINIP